MTSAQRSMVEIAVVRQVVTYPIVGEHMLEWALIMGGNRQTAYEFHHFRMICIDDTIHVIFLLVI